MVKRSYFLFFLAWLLGPLALSAQKGAKVVADDKTRQPVDYVFIQSDDNAIKLLSNKEGRFILAGESAARYFSFHKMGYRRRSIATAELAGMDTVFLTEKSIELAEVVISNNKLDTLVKDKRYYVDDYLVLPDNNFLIITSKINVSGFDVCYYDKNKGITQTKKIKDETDARFVTDCFRNIHLLSNRYSRQLAFDSDTSFEFLPKYNRAVFDSALGNCMLKVDTQVILKYELPPMKIDIGLYDIKQSSPFIVYHRVSRHARRPFYSVAYNTHMQEMIRYEISDAAMTSLNDYRRQNQIMLFFNKIAGPIYAPLFLKNDTVVVFNFQEYKIVFLNKAGKRLREVSMDKNEFQVLRNFEILCDQPAQKFYLKMRDADRSYIKRIDIYSGKISKTIKLEKIFARNIQIVNDHIYYLVREKQWDDTQYLYRQN